MKILCRLLIFIYFLIPNATFAHPGGLDGNDCHTCRTNCEEKYGIPTGDYHCHATGDKSVYTSPPTPGDPVPISDPDPVIGSNTSSGEQIDNEAPREQASSPEILSSPIAHSNTSKQELSPVVTTSSKPGTEEPLIEEEEASQEPVDDMPLEEIVDPEGQEGSVLLGFLVLGGVGYGTYRGGKAGFRKVKKMLS